MFCLRNKKTRFLSRNLSNTLMITLQAASNLEYDIACMYLTTVTIVFWDVIHY